MKRQIELNEAEIELVVSALRLKRNQVADVLRKTEKDRRLAFYNRSRKLDDLNEALTILRQVQAKVVPENE